MICINLDLLTQLGGDPELDIHSFKDVPGLAASGIFSFGGRGGGGADVAALDAELRSGPPRALTLTLVGMEDRYDVGRKRGVAIVELCTHNGTHRLPSAAERVLVAQELRRRIDHPKAVAIANLFDPA